VLLPFEALREKKGITLGKVQLWRLERAGKFPKRVHVSVRSIGWPESEIDEYLRQRAAARTAPTGASA
jgi:prophage regulatory protein